MAWHKRLHKWLAGAEPQGFGTLLLGVAALFALWGTDSMFDKVLDIQSQAKDIKVAVSTLQGQSADLAHAIRLLHDQIKELTVARTFESSSALSAPNPSKEEIEKALDENLSSRPSESGSVILPADKRAAVVEQIYRAKNPRQRSVILRNSLEYSAPSQGIPTLKKPIDQESQ